MRKLPSAVRALIITIVVGGVAVGACLAALIPGAATLVASEHYTSNAVKDLSALDQRSTIYDSAGGVMAVLGTQNREEVTLDQVPKILQDAVIAVEDQTFWENDGIDPNALLRAAIKNLTSGEIEQGGSTITQQLVKNRILTNKRDINRKIREVVLAIRLNEKYSKNEILEQYLNTVYFGQGSYGVKAAVERFFLVQSPFGVVPAVDLSQVTVGQAALLAGLINNPEGNNPFVNPEGAAARRKLALEQMVDQGYITQEQADAANAEPLPTLKPEAELRPKTSWAEEVQDRLFNDPMFEVLGKTPKERQDAVLKGGLKIYATLDPKLQADAQAAMDSGLASAAAGFTGVIVAMDPSTGAVKAMVAGPGFEQSQYNIATSYPGRQAGSTWKAITLAAALESGYSPNDKIDGRSPCSFGTYGRTQNAEGGGGSITTLRQATAGSINCAFARLELSVGFNKVIEQAKKMGLTQDTLKPVLTLTLGAVETTMLEMATVASTIASGGIHHSPTFVSKIVGPDGQVIWDAAQVPGDRAMTAENAACQADIMQGVFKGGGTASGKGLAGRPAAGKTGTTDNRADANFLGYTPQLAAFVWHGNAAGRIPGAGFGGNIPATIFKRFMDAALADQPVVPFPPPGPSCARPGAAITENGRVAGSGDLFPGETVPTVAPPTVVVQPTTPTTKPVITVPTLPTTTTAPPP